MKYRFKKIKFFDDVKISLFILLVFLFPLAGNSSADGLDTLIDLARSQGEIQKDSENETDNFKKIKEEIGKGLLSIGQSKSSILSKYGKPVVIIEGSPEKRERWVYKSADSSFFKGDKVYLFFDENDALAEIKVLE